MKVKVVYRKNLQLTEAKVAAQVTHAVIGLGIRDPQCTIVVLGVSDKKFWETIMAKDTFIHEDFGYTEVERGTPTAAAWIEEG